MTWRTTSHLGDCTDTHSRAFLVATLLLALTLPANAQTTFEIPLKGGTVTLQQGRFDVGAAARAAGPSVAQYAIVQFERNLHKTEIDKLRSAGIAPLSFLHEKAWLCSVKPGALSDAVIADFGIVATAPWEPKFKLSPKLAQKQFEPWAMTSEGKVKLLVTFFEDVDRSRIEGILGAYAAAPIFFQQPNVWAVEVDPAFIESLIAEPSVQAIEEGPAPFEPTNEGSRAILGVDAVQDVDLLAVPPHYYGLSGLGVTVAVSESVTTTHPDFMNHDASGAETTPRFLNPSIFPGADHGTHVAGTIGGNGWNSALGINRGSPYQWRGMAPEATLVSGSGYGTYTIHASNHSYVMSYGTYTCGYACPDALDRDIRGGDGLVYQRPHVWAAANQGTSPQYNDEEGYYSIYAPAKNVLAVGAVNANDGSLAAFSSLGPTFDGRIKPDVVAAGCNNTIAPETPVDAEVTVTIDYVRIYDPDASTHGATCSSVPTSGGAQPTQCWEFNQDGNFEGWLEESLSIYNKRVVNGALEFEVKPLKDQGGDHAFGWVNNLTVATGPNQFIEVQYSIGPVPAPFGADATFLWRRAGSSNYVEGVLGGDISVDGQFHVMTVPVGQFGMDLDMSGNDIWPTGVKGWTGTITSLRLDPLGSGAILSTAKEGGAYATNCGTSMAAPAVTGTVALLLEQFKQTKGIDLDTAPPLPSTVKAVLVETATDLIHTSADPRDPDNPDTGTPVLYYAGPDFATGYGLVNAPAAINLIANSGTGFGCDSAGGLTCESALDVSQREGYEVNLPAGLVDFKVTLAWDDMEGSTATAETTAKLVNDLDLVLVDPQGGFHYAWKLDPLPVASCGGAGPGCGDPDPIAPADVKPAYKARDHRNNVEQVMVNSPQAGKWRVLVEGFNIQNATTLQSYSLVAKDQLAKLQLKAGDINADACVDRKDLDILLADIRGSAPHNGVNDLNGDGFINIADARWLAVHFTRPLGASCQ